MDLIKTYGPLMGGEDLWLALGFKTGPAFRHAIREHSVPLNIFEIPGRRGKFALTEDVEKWLEEVSTPRGH